MPRTRITIVVIANKAAATVKSISWLSSSPALIMQIITLVAIMAAAFNDLAFLRTLAGRLFLSLGRSGSNLPIKTKVARPICPILNTNKMMAIMFTISSLYMARHFWGRY